MEEGNQLDLTSEVFVDRGSSQHKPARHRVRVFFGCCKVYAQITVPDGVRQRMLSSWKFHCPRCAQLIEIPLDGP